MQKHTGMDFAIFTTAVTKFGPILLWSPVILRPGMTTIEYY